MTNFSIATVAVLITALCWTSCNNDPKTASGHHWVFEKKISLDSFGIVGITPANDKNLWLSDADNNRLLKISPNGQVLDTLTGFDRPMHIAEQESAVLVAEYGADMVRAIHHSKSDTLDFPEAFDAPSGVDIEGDFMAVADFYNHRIVFTKSGTNLTFGQKGNGKGQFTYPTDVQFAHGKLWVADAYNHRVQVFDLGGKYLATLGEADKMNATTGLFVGETELFATDFENSRLLVYDLEGNSKQVISENLNNPTDVLQIGNQLFVVNYRGRFLTVYKK